MPIRFALLVSGTTFEQWEIDCVDHLLAIPGVELALLIVDARPPVKPNPWYRKWRALRHFNTLGWELYRQRFVQTAIPLRQRFDLAPRFQNVPRINAQVIRKGKFSEYFSPEDVARIRALDLAFMIRFGFNILRGEVLSSARYGIWSFHHDDLEKYRGSPPCFWEIYFGDPQTGVTLQRLTDRLDSGVVLRKESFPTCFESYPRNLERALQFGVPWPADLCRGILRGETACFETPASSSGAPIFRSPTNAQLLRLLWRSRNTS